MAVIHQCMILIKIIFFVAIVELRLAGSDWLLMVYETPSDEKIAADLEKWY